uniref:TIR domain-containing protein n=1 Tax=Arion vulgaris TaxID=1028688 RepID=A0A0B6ZIP1_9EUPU
MASMEQLNWRNYLDPAHYDVPLHALRYSVCVRLAYHLDETNLLMYNGVVPNFGGLAELAGFDGLQIHNMERAKSPTKQLFDDWKCRPDLKPTVGRLIEFLTVLGREDILTDCQSMIRDEVTFFLNRNQHFNEMKPGPIQDETVSSGPGCEELPRHITIHDVTNMCETHYDAFICFNPNGDSSKDLEFVRELISRLEGPKYKFRFFVPHRDDLAGLNAHSISAKIISERCRHMIVVLSPNFLASPACDFQSSFAHSLSPGARNKRIVPIKIQDCPTPNILRIMACCDFTKRDLWDWAWERLARSIMVPLYVEDFQVIGSHSLDGLIQPTNIDLSSVLESGVYSRSHSPVSSRPSSPSSRHNNLMGHTQTRSSEMQKSSLIQTYGRSNTPPLDSQKVKSISPSGALGMFFGSRKFKTKYSSTDQNS